MAFHTSEYSLSYRFSRDWGYELVGNKTNILDRVLVQKKDGRFYLMLWQVIPIYNVDAQTDIKSPGSTHNGERLIPPSGSGTAHIW